VPKARFAGRGRYDYLIEQIGGKPAPAVGWALGVERVLDILGAQQLLPGKPALDAYAVVTDVAMLPQVAHTLERLRDLGVSVQMHAATGAGEAMGSMKSQFKKADASGAAFALIFGTDELARGCVTVKSLRDGQGQQVEHELAHVATWAGTLQSTT
jgi:histidyl-tRNA synthetase